MPRNRAGAVGVLGGTMWSTRQLRAFVVAATVAGLALAAPSAATADDDVPRAALTVDEVARTQCSAAAVRPLSDQLLAEVACLRPGVLAAIDDIPGALVPPAKPPVPPAKPPVPATPRAALGKKTVPPSQRLDAEDDDVVEAENDG